MKIITDQDIFVNPKFRKQKKYKKRVTVKAIVKNTQNKFAFVTNPIHNFILLPGGGAGSEKLEREIDRECQEEIFYSIKNIRELIRVGEFRNRDAKKYETICFLLK